MYLGVSAHFAICVMAGQTPYQKLGDDLTCSICYDRFTDPKLLTCQHKFCLDCIRNVTPEHVIKCPLCRQYTELPDGGVDILPTANINECKILAD